MAHAHCLTDLHLGARQKSGIKIVLIALVADLAVAAIKFAAALASGSTAMSSEGVHSLVDASTEIILLYGLIVSGRAATPQHQFGYGREVYFWNFVVAVLIFALGSGVALLDGLHQLAAARPLGRIWINYAVLACSTAVETAALCAALTRTIAFRGKETIFRFLQRRRDPTALTIIFGGGAALIGLIVTAFGLGLSELTDDSRFDGAASVVISIILALTAFKLASESKNLLIGVPADETVAQQITSDVARHSFVNCVNGMTSVHLAPEQLLVALSVSFKDGLSITQVEQAIAELEDDLRGDFPQIVALFIKPQSPERYERLNGTHYGRRPESRPRRS